MRSSPLAEKRAFVLINAQQKLWRRAMKAFLSAVAFIVVVAAAAPYLLPGMQQNASSAFTTSSVRIDDPGSNLIGKN
jgi:hypothetical protein